MITAGIRSTSRTDPGYVHVFFDQRDGDGRPWKRCDLTGAGVRNGETGEPWRGIDVTSKGRHSLDQFQSSLRFALSRFGFGLTSLRFRHALFEIADSRCLSTVDDRLGVPPFG